MQKVATFVGVLSKGHLFRPSVTLWSFSGLDSLRTFTFPQRLFSGSAPDSGAPDSGSGSAPDSGSPPASLSLPALVPYYYDTNWTPTEGCLTYQQYYEKDLRPILEECYPQFSNTYPWEKEYHLIGVNDLVSLANRYPKSFWPHGFKKEIVDKRVAVEDPELNYPPFISGSPLILRDPIHLVTPLLPPLGFHKIYVDGSPNPKFGMPGGGGVAVVDGFPGRLSAFKVWVASGNALETELRVLIAAARYATEAGFERVILVSDCLDVIEGLKGGRYIRESLQGLSRELLTILKGFKEVVFEHSPREGLAFVDALARQMKDTMQFQTYNLPKYTFEQATLYEIEYDTQLVHVKQKWKKLEERLPVFRFEILWNLPMHPKLEDIVSQQRFCPMRE